MVLTRTKRRAIVLAASAVLVPASIIVGIPTYLGMLFVSECTRHLKQLVEWADR